MASTQQSTWNPNQIKWVLGPGPSFRCVPKRRKEQNQNTWVSGQSQEEAGNGVSEWLPPGPGSTQRLTKAQSSQPAGGLSGCPCWPVGVEAQPAGEGNFNQR